MSIDLIIFDCDGVLIDSEVIACRIDAEVLSSVGLAITLDEVIERFAGVSEKDIRAAVERDLGRPLPADYEARINQRTREAMSEELRAIAGVEALLTRLSVPFCVASSSNPAKLRFTLTLTALYDLLAPNIFSSAQVSNGKPAPDLFLYAAGRMGAHPARCLVVEDSTAGVRAAKAAGMQAIGFVGGSHCRPGHAERLRAAGAEMVIDSFARLERVAGLSGGATAGHGD